MSKVIKHSRIKFAQEKAGKKTRTKHNHYGQGKTGYIPGTISHPVNLKLSKR